MISIIPLVGIPKISYGDDLTKIIAQKLPEYFPLTKNDCLVVASKVISKSRGRIVNLNQQRSVSEIVDSESKLIIRKCKETVIAETPQGFICTNAGVSESNTDLDTVVLLPKNSDTAAHGIRRSLEVQTGFDIPVIISDSFKRPFRKGTVDVALGYSGIRSYVDLHGEKDFYGRKITSSKIAIADEIASAAELAMHSASGVCAVLIRGIPEQYRGEGKATDMVRSPQEELFR